eukprot:2853816-Amphidinium_carterae.1
MQLFKLNSHTLPPYARTFKSNGAVHACIVVDGAAVEVVVGGACCSQRLPKRRMQIHNTGKK